MFLGELCYNSANMSFSTYAMETLRSIGETVIGASINDSYLETLTTSIFVFQRKEN